MVVDLSLGKDTSESYAFEVGQKNNHISTVIDQFSKIWFSKK